MLPTANFAVNTQAAKPMSDCMKDLEHLFVELERQGWRVRRGKHYFVYPPDKTLSPVSIPITTSRYRSFQNTLARLRARGAKV